MVPARGRAEIKNRLTPEQLVPAIIIFLKKWLNRGLKWYKFYGIKNICTAKVIF